MIRLFTLASLILSLFLVSCNKDNQAETDRDLIENYLNENNIDASVTEEGVYYIIENEGVGESSPTVNSTVEVQYKGYLLDGTVFDETMGSATYSSTLGNLIQGWQIGIPLLKKGGSGTLFIPSGLGYGSTAAGIIPSNSVLIFDINLVDFSN